MGGDTFSTATEPTYQFTFDHEIGTGPFESRRPHWPGGQSGVTIGPGYDMRLRTAQEIIGHLTAAGVDEEIAGALSGAAGLSSATDPTAEAWVEAHAHLMITREQERTLFDQVLVPIYEGRARQYVDDRFGNGTGADLSTDQKEMLFDYAYNPGLGEFPNFTAHVVNCNWNGALQEYERGGVGQRNDDFRAAYLDPRMAGTVTLTGSVGTGGQNRPEDVEAVQRQLVALGFDWLAVDGLIGPQTIGAIQLFQAICRGHQRIAGAGVDGRVDVNGATNGWLNTVNAPRWQRMPAGSRVEGYENFEVTDPTDQHDFGTNWLADVIRGAGTHYRDEHLAGHAADALITVNDASLPRGGDTPDHSGHETDLSCDLRLPRQNGTAPGNTTIHDATYDRAAMRAMLQAFQQQPLVSRIFLNDATLVAEGLCAAAAGHDDHVHVEIRPPERNS